MSQIKKEDLICNQITVLDLFLKQLFTREHNIKDMETFKIYFESVYENLLSPAIEKIKKTSQKMEDGLIKRQVFLKQFEMEDLYQKAKKEFQETLDDQKLNN